MSYARQKGTRNENKCKELLEEQGWLVDKVEKKGKFLKNKDLFGLFDLIAIGHNRSKLYHPTVYYVDVNFVQVTTNKPHTLKPYIEFAQKWVCLNIHVTMYVWIDRRGFILYDFKSDGSYSRTKLWEENND